MLNWTRTPHLYFCFIKLFSRRCKFLFSSWKDLADTWPKVGKTIYLTKRRHYHECVNPRRATLDCSNEIPWWHAAAMAIDDLLQLYSFTGKQQRHIRNARKYQMVDERQHTVQLLSNDTWVTLSKYNVWSRQIWFLGFWSFGSHFAGNQCAWARRVFPP